MEFRLFEENRRPGFEDWGWLARFAGFCNLLLGVGVEFGDSRELWRALVEGEVGFFFLKLVKQRGKFLKG